MWLLLSLLCLAPAERLTVVDGPVLRWADDRSEVALFGVNYYPPFASDYAGLGRLGMDRQAVMEQDLEHLVRLGVQALRLHCWDREISDHEGNLLENEHLALLDDLIAAAKRRGLYTVLTPIAWWGTSNPSPGFSTIYDIFELTTDAGVPRAVQQRYLRQFVTHRNPATGLTYADDPAVLAFEMINEPQYPKATTDAAITEYADALLAAVRETGCRKPLYMSYFSSRVVPEAASTADGITFGWYPLGLVNGVPQTYDALPRLADFPLARHPAAAGKLKAFYEFDAADVLGTYLYPAMARTFRAVGAQWACQFQYDAWPLAASNLNWQTHWLSLPYTPAKAISFAIAGETFRQLPRGVDAPGETFGPTTVSYAADRSELVTGTIFAHSNDTTTRPPQPAALEHLYGVGSSPLVQYDGTGAWFLDRIAPGAWRLEVYPDAVVLDNPFASPALDREVARVVWRSRTMTLDLPDLGAGFTVEPLADAGAAAPTVAGGQFAVTPGVWRLTRADGPRPAMVADWFAPPADPDAPLRVAHLAPDALIADEARAVDVTISDDTLTPQLWVQTGDRWHAAPMTVTGPYQRRGLLPAAALGGEVVRYAVSAAGRTWPDDRPGTPDTWPTPPGPLTLFDATELAAPLPGPRGNNMQLTRAGDAVRLSAPTGFPTPAKVAEGEPLPSGGVRLPARAGRAEDRVVVIRARATDPETTSFELGLVQDDGAAWGGPIPLTGEWSTSRIPLAELRRLWAPQAGRPDPTRITAISLVFGTWLYGERSAAPHGFELASVALEAGQPGWTVPVEPVGPPVPLLRAAAAARSARTRQGGSGRLLELPGGRPGFELNHTGFGAPPASYHVNVQVPEASPARRAAMAGCTHLRVTARGTTPAATGFELVLIEANGAPWGVDIPLTTAWQTLDLPLSDLRYFSHWTRIPDRGGNDDRLHPEAVTRVQLTIGAWLNPDHAGRPWQVQIAAIELLP